MFWSYLCSGGCVRLSRGGSAGWERVCVCVCVLMCVRVSLRAYMQAHAWVCVYVCVLVCVCVCVCMRTCFCPSVLTRRSKDVIAPEVTPHTHSRTHTHTCEVRMSWRPLSQVVSDRAQIHWPVVLPYMAATFTTVPLGISILALTFSTQVSSGSPFSFCIFRHKCIAE